MLKKILTGLGVLVVVALIVIQFIRPEKNNSDVRTNDITTAYTIPAEVNQLLEVSCFDCHSNNTRYPWYAKVQPVGWWLNDHITEGKRHLNFSDFTGAPLFVQNHRFDEIIETVEKKEMPLRSYTYLGMHSDADLSDAQRQMIMDWAKEQMTYLQNNYPADSLAFPRRDGERPPSNTP